MRNDLIEAYVGRREDELRAQYNVYVQREAELQKAEGGDCVAVTSFEYWSMDAAEQMALADSPAQRLEEYLHWNGIIGYTSAIFAIATGEV